MDIYIHFSEQYLWGNYLPQSSSLYNYQMHTTQYFHLTDPYWPSGPRLMMNSLIKLSL